MTGTASEVAGDTDDNVVEIRGVRVDGPRHGQIANLQGANAPVRGHWAAADVDDGAELRLVVNGFDVGLLTGLGSNAELVFQGRYGELIFRGDGTYRYELTARAEKIAAGETPDDIFAIRVVDEHAGRPAGDLFPTSESNLITLTVTVTGANDAPIDLTGDYTGAVTESGYRTDDDADDTVSGVTPAKTTVTAPPVRSDAETVTTAEARRDRGTNDVNTDAADHTITGVLDAIDSDRVDGNGRGDSDAIDEHSFTLLGGAANTNDRSATADGGRKASARKPR